jgi:polygalacturonase
MRKYPLLLLCAMLAISVMGKKSKNKNMVFPDGSPIGEWFNDTTKAEVESLGKKYVLTDFGVKNDSTVIQTSAIQHVIDHCYEQGGGVIVVPKGTFLTGALFFKKGTHLHFEDGGKIKGIDDIRHYPLIKMHMEGKMIDYFAALVTAEHCDSFTITGRGTIDGNGQRFWDEFWIRRKQNPKCTNLEALRPQLVYISHSDDVTIQDVQLINSPFWTNHLYHANRVKFLDCFIKSPAQGTTHTPSSDAIDLDICDDVLVRGCYINICDDGVCLKGGKGTYVDQDSTAGAVNRVIVENCRFGNRTNAGITFGSEAWDCHNVIMRNCQFDDADHMLLFKMRPDTPQQYGDVLMENCWGTSKYPAIEVSTWTQFYNKNARPDMPESSVRNVTIRGLMIQTSSFFRVRKTHNIMTHQFALSDFTFEDIEAEDKDNAFDIDQIDGVTVKNVLLNGISK